MRLTKERKILLTVCGLAVTLLAADQLFLGSGALEPQEAAGRDFRDSTESDESDSAPAAQAVTRGRCQAILAARIDALGVDGPIDPNSLRDVFRPGNCWKDQPAQSEQEVLVETVVQQFRDAHTLDAVAADGQGGGSAVVNGKCIRVGQAVSGFELIGLDRRWATFRNEAGVSVRLRLKTLESRR